MLHGRLLDDETLSDERLIAGERPPLLALFERRAAEDETPYRAIMDSLYFFQARIGWLHLCQYMLS